VKGDILVTFKFSFQKIAV